MTDQDLLEMLKANLEKRNSINDGYLTQLISAAKSAIAQEGITLSESEYEEDEANLIVMYAAYLYEMRRPSSDRYRTDNLYPQGMPYMLRLALNNRLFSQKMGSSS